MRIFITHILPGEEGMKANVSIAATNFSLNLISNGAFDKVYSILPPFVNGKIEDLSNCNIETIYCQRLRKRALSKFAAVLEQAKVFWKIPKRSHVWLYNLTALNGILVKLLRLFKPSVRIYTIVLDFTPGEASAERWLPTINSCDGRIILSLSNRFNKKNTICIPGVTPYERIDWPKVRIPTKTFLISGQLGDNISLLSKLLPVFSKHPEWILNITGKTPETANEYSEKYSNIICYGECPYSKFVEILHRSSFLLSTRDPHMPENQCNFPSKIIEGLLHNRIIISTIDYPQLNPIKYIKIDADNLEEGFKDIASKSYNNLLEYANQSELTDQMYNTRRWAKEIEKIERCS